MLPQFSHVITQSLGQLSAIAYRVLVRTRTGKNANTYFKKVFMT